MNAKRQRALNGLVGHGVEASGQKMISSVKCSYECKQACTITGEVTNRYGSWLWVKRTEVDAGSDSHTRIRKHVLAKFAWHAEQAVGCRRKQRAEAWGVKVQRCARITWGPFQIRLFMRLPLSDLWPRGQNRNSKFPRVSVLFAVKSDKSQIVLWLVICGCKS